MTATPCHLQPDLDRIGAMIAAVEGFEKEFIRPLGRVGLAAQFLPHPPVVSSTPSRRAIRSSPSSRSLSCISIPGVRRPSACATSLAYRNGPFIWGAQTAPARILAT